MDTHTEQIHREQITQLESIIKRQQQQIASFTTNYEKVINDYREKITSLQNDNSQLQSQKIDLEAEKVSLKVIMCIFF